MRAFDREVNDQRLLRKANKNVSDNIENRIDAYIKTGLATLILTDEATGTRYQITIINGELQLRQL